VSIKDRPVQVRQVREAQCRRQGGIRQPHTECHDGQCCESERQTRPALQERNLIGANDVDYKGLGHQGFDEPARLETGTHAMDPNN